jgi:hypothetical protein
MGIEWESGNSRLGKHGRGKETLGGDVLGRRRRIAGRDAETVLWGLTGKVKYFLFL